MTGKEIRNILAKNIKYFRNVRGFSQAQLAEASEISIPFLSAIERGTKWPYPETIAKLADALDINISLLFSDDVKLKKEDIEITDIVRVLIENQQHALKDVYERFFEKLN